MRFNGDVIHPRHGRPHDSWLEFLRGSSFTSTGDFISYHLHLCLGGTALELPCMYPQAVPEVQPIHDRVADT